MGMTDKHSKERMPLYMSRAQLKRHTSSYVCFSLDIYNISPKVNMPLLRLLNQIATMHQNVKSTNEELKEKKPMGSEDEAAPGVTPGGKKPDYMRHKKTSSGSSTSSNISVPIRRDTGLTTIDMLLFFCKKSLTCLEGK